MRNIHFTLAREDQREAIVLLSRGGLLRPFALDKQRAARSPFQSFVFPSNVGTRAGEGRVGARRCRRFLFAPEGRAGFFAGFRPANKRSFAPREL